ncbi:hypothetical protein VB773_06405 [Haloarculaceae archaeon H-GB2-1]|nr:hypothetical protein [Haloarculaceae archaeon H-GB2-1]
MKADISQRLEAAAFTEKTNIAVSTAILVGSSLVSAAAGVGSFVNSFF